MLKPVRTKKFDKSIALCKKRGYDMDLLKEVVKLLLEEKPLPERCCVHKLHGDLADCWDCHIKSDWVLIYRYDYPARKLIFEDTGTHSDLF